MRLICIVKNLVKKLKKFLQSIILIGYCQRSFSQCGEDLIIKFVFDAIGEKNPTYLDIGANHPIFLNNTFLFYKKGNKGVLVEPDPYLYSIIKKIRHKDVCLNAGIGVTEVGSADFYIMTSKTLNTFSRYEAERYVNYGNQKIEKIITMPLLNINDIIKTHFDKSPNYISIDIEGLDYEVMKGLDFSKYRPQVICIETLTYTEDKSESKNDELINLMLDNGYFVYADTYINTIFVDKQVWLTR